MLKGMKITTAEEIGIKSSCVNKFLDVLENNNIRMHSFLLMRDGKIGAEGYWKPYTEETTHRMYSVTKSFVGTAIGALADEGKISLDDKIVKFFPDLVSDNVHPYIKEATIRNLLMMCTMYSKPTYNFGENNWLESYFTAEPDHPAGTVFNYDSSGSYVLSAIVKRVTGKPFDEYLMEKILLKLGYEPSRKCIKGPDGESWGGSGLVITTRELAALANLYYNKGSFDGEQLLSKEFCEEAVKPLVVNCVDGSDYSYHKGYGYQIWILKDNAFFFNGMGGQMAIVFPDTGLIFACTADIQGNPCGKHQIFEALWNEIKDKIEEPMPIDEYASEKLRERCKKLTPKPLDGASYSETEKLIDGKKYILDSNPMGISEICFSFNKDFGKIEYKTPRGNKEIHFGRKNFLEGIFPETHYPGEQLNEEIGREYRSICSASWADKNTLIVSVHILDDYVGNITMTFGFNENKIGVSMKKYAQFFLDEYNGFAGGKTIDFTI